MAADKSKLEEEARILRFYKIVLPWDYLRILEESEKRNHDKKIGEGGVVGLKKVKDTYTEVDDYFNTFDPFIFLGGQSSDISATVWQQAIIAECSEVNGFHLPTVICSDADAISQNDLLLLSTKKFGEGKELPTAYAFALVEHRQQDKIRLQLYLSGEIKSFDTDDVQTCSRLLNMLPLVCEVQKYLFVLKICSLSTILCEYVTLRSICSLPFKDLILTAVDIDSKIEDRAWKISRPLTNFIEANHNKSQLEAINAGLSRKTFFLIQIRSFPSKEFYHDGLKDVPDVENHTKHPWHGFSCFGPFCFFDIHEGKESQSSGSGSWVNVDEAEFVLVVYSKLVSRYPELKTSSRLAIISQHRHQIKLFRENFRNTFGVGSVKVVDINTVDGFQGRKKDVAIFSCVRASKERGIGFVADFRRMNVGITHARSSVLVSKPYTEFFSDSGLKANGSKEIRVRRA